jgi:predicted PurR-regulated permease PerM
MVLAFFLVFIFFKDGQTIIDFIYQITPLAENTKSAVFSQINGTLGAVIRGQMLTSLAQSVIAGIVFASLGLPGPIFFALVTFLASLIPVLGAQMIWLPLVGFLVLSNQMTKAIILFVLGVGVISLVDNLMKPALIGEKTKLPYSLLFFGILGGLKVYGLMGVFLAPVILSLFFALIKIYRENFFSSDPAHLEK